MIIEPINYATETRLKIPTPPGTLDCVVVSGYAQFDTNGAHRLTGSDLDDEQWLFYTVNLIVGPKWLRLDDVSVTVTRSGHIHYDQADWVGYQISQCSWEPAGLPEPNQDKQRIRLVIKELGVSGGMAHVQLYLAYHLTATGTLAKKGSGL